MFRQDYDYTALPTAYCAEILPSFEGVFANFHVFKYMLW